MAESRAKELKSLYIIGGVAALLQLVTILGYSLAAGILGPKPTTAEGYFAMYQAGAVQGVLRGDFLLLILIVLYLGTFPALYAALRRVSPVYAALATLLTCLAVGAVIATESTFSLLRLSEQYAAALTDAQRAQFLAAGEAVIASDMWHCSGAYMSGIFLQGSGVLISVIMLRSKDFSKVTAYAGLLGNALDLFQHLIHPFAPALSEVIKMVMGLPYLIWYPLLAWDLLRLGRGAVVLSSANQENVV